MNFRHDPDGSSQHQQPKRRKDARKKIVVEAAIHSPNHGEPLHARTANLSGLGCYVEMKFTLAVGTPVTIDLVINDAKLSAQGVIITRDPQVGNGIKFVKLADADRVRLRGFLVSVGAEV